MHTSHTITVNIICITVMNMRKTINRLRAVIIFLIGGSAYICIEILWRILHRSEPTHWTMFFLGGCAFYCISKINDRFPEKTVSAKKCILGTFAILLLEFVSGCALNIWLSMGIWDYTHLPMNIMGQVCLPFAIAWYGLTAIAFTMDRFIKHKIFHRKLLFP